MYTHGIGMVNIESELWSAKSWDICDELSRLLYIDGNALYPQTDIYIVSKVTASPTKEGCHWQAGGENRQTWQLANPAWYP